MQVHTNLRTLEQIQQTIRVARDSVQAIENEMKKLSQNVPWSTEIQNNIQRNVDHLRIIVADDDVKASGENIADLHNAIAIGEEELENRS